MSDPSAALAAGFPEPSHADWLALVEATLKGGGFERRLVTRTADGIEVQPLYTRDMAPASLNPSRRPAADPARPWDLRTLVDHPDPARANADALADLQGGGASILLKLDPSGRDGVAVASRDDLSRVLDGVLLDLAPVALDAGFLGSLAADWLGELAKGAPRAPLAFHLDPLGAFARAGASPGPIEAHVAQAARTAARLADTYPQAELFLASGRVVHEAGGTQAQELGFVAANALAYVRELQGAGVAPAAAMARVTLGLAADGEPFTTLAKLRAMRAIWSRLAKALGSEAPARIEVRSSRRGLSTLDPWTNLLRLAAAGFGAALGGADAIQLDAFTRPLQDETAARPSRLARRQARNIQLVLMEEGHVGRVADPAGGSWYVEALSDQLARAGWAWMQGAEAQGGLVAALRSGRIAGEVAQARDRLAREVATRKTPLIGVSEFPNLLEDGVEVEPVDPQAFARTAPPTTIAGPDGACPPLTPWRAARPFERLRAQAASQASRPHAFLATLGPLSDHGARASFTRNLLAAGGITATAGEVGAYSALDAPLAVICGSDAAYAQGATAAVRALKAAGARQVWLAGRPGPLASALEAAGLDGAVFAGGDVVAALGQALEAAA